MVNDRRAPAVELHRADPRARRNALMVLLGGTLAGLILLALVESAGDDLRRWITSDPRGFDMRFRVVTWCFALLACGPILGFATYLWMFGRRVISEGRFPPSGVAMLADTIVLRDAQARARGRLLQALAGLLAVAASGLAVLILRLPSLLQTRLP
jgi:hypothetical protein